MALPWEKYQGAAVTEPPPWEKYAAVPSLDEQTITPDEPLSERIRKFLFKPEGAQTTREAIQGAVESIPGMITQLPKQAYQGVKFAVGGPDERMQVIQEALREGVPMGVQTAEDIQAPFGTPEFLRGAGQMGMMALPGLELARELRAPVEIPREMPPVEPPPVQAPPVAPVVEAPLPYTQEAAAARAQQPPPTEPPTTIVKPPATPETPQVTSTKNAVVDQERATRGLPPAMQALKREGGTVWDEVMRDVEKAASTSDPHPADSIIARFKQKPFALTDKDTFTLLHRQVELQNAFDKLAGDLNAARDAGDLGTVAEHNIKLAELGDSLLDVYDVGRRGGTETARGLQSRQQFADENFSLANMVTHKRASLGGRPLTEPEVAKVEATRARILNADARLAAYKKSLARRIADYKARTAAGDFAPRVARKIALDREARMLQAEAAKAREEWQRGLLTDRLKNRGRVERFSDFLIKWRRAFVLSGVRSIGKLASAAVEGMVIAPVREAIGGVMGQVPGLRRIFAKASMEGGFNLRAETRAIGETFRNLISDFGKNLKGQKPEFEQLYGPMRNTPQELNNYVGFLHGALKSPLARNVWTRQFVKGLDHAARRGIDITDPLVQMEIGRQAYDVSQFWRFQNKNVATRAYNGLLRILEAKSKETGEPTAVGKAASFLARAELPVVTVPTNIVARLFESVFGVGLGAGRVAKAYMRGIENLTPAQADIIARNLKTGGLGLGLFLTGYFNPDMFGGYYRRGHKEGEKGEPTWGATRVAGYDIPAYLMHNPFLEAAQMGATVRRTTDELLAKGDRTKTEAALQAMWTGVSGAVQEQPFVREAEEATQLLEPEKAGDIAGRHVASLITPQLVSQTASFLDPAEKRYPRGFTQRIMSGIPGLREQLPVEPLSEAKKTPLQKAQSEQRKARPKTLKEQIREMQKGG